MACCCMSVTVLMTEGTCTCVAYIDDLLILGKNVQDLREEIQVVRLKGASLRLNPGKYQRMTDTVTYLGHVFSK